MISESLKGSSVNTSEAENADFSLSLSRFVVVERGEENRETEIDEKLFPPVSFLIVMSFSFSLCFSLGTDAEEKGREFPSLVTFSSEIIAKGLNRIKFNGNDFLICLCSFFVLQHLDENSL